jgi:hypothetical protein
MFTWLALPDLPPVPDHFVDRAISAVQDPNFCNEITANYEVTNQATSYRTRKLLRDGKETNSLYLSGKRIGEDWEHWVKQNIVPEFHETGVRVATGENTTTHGAHADSWQGNPPRASYKFYYLLQSGGEQVETVFYKQTDCPVERQPTKQNPVTIYDYSSIQEIDRVKFSVGQWVLLNTNILHGVENVIGQRINLTVIAFADTVKLSVCNPNKSQN